MQVLARLPAAIEVTSLAEKFGMSRSYFSHVFRERTGITPAHFATEVRIKQVEGMLRATCEPLKTIAAACGFANANHPCKVFRRLRHNTPTAFRQSVRHWNMHLK
jgi:AraC family transcriptional regulator